MSTTTSEYLEENPVLRQLPPGHEDPEADYYIKPEHREFYVREPVPADSDSYEVGIWFTELQTGERLARQTAEHRADLAAWEQERARRESLGPESLARFLRDHRKADGSPRLTNVGQFDGAVLRPPGLPPMPPEWAAFPEFWALRKRAQERAGHLAYIQEQRERIKRERTCAVCDTSNVDTELSPATGKDRVCEPCARAVELVVIFAAKVSAGTDRTAAVIDYLTQRGTIDARALSASGEDTSRPPLLRRLGLRA